MNHEQTCVWGILGQNPHWNPEHLAALVAKFGGTDVEFDGERLWANMTTEQFSACMDAYWDRGMAA
mgnify:CR=1 FL=1